MARAGKTLLVLLCLWTARGLPAAAEPGTAADVTERGRGLDRILDAVLTRRAGTAGPRTLLLLVDPTPSLAAAGFADELEAALSRNTRKLEGARIGVARTGSRGPLALAPTAEPGPVAAAVSGLFASPKKTFQDVYADVRRLASTLAGTEGSREIVLVTLENGDAEGELEATAAALARTGVRISVIARQAFLSDTFWIQRASQAPRRLEMHGGEAAFVEVPWGWLFQNTVVNEAVLSGFAMYGLSRLAAASGGRVFVFYPPSGTGHRCSISSGCLFCRGDHIPSGESYQTHRLRALAPFAGPRRTARARALKDPYYQAVLRAWRRGSREGLLRSRPALRPDGSPERRQLGRWPDLTGSLSFDRHAARAEKLARTAAEIADDLDAGMARGKATGGSARYRAIADYTRLMLRLTRVNALAFAAWCREVAPGLLSRGPDDFAPPEIPPFSPDQRPVGIGFTTFSLCHGVRPFREVHLPGGEAFRRELAGLAVRVEGFLARQAHTPFAVALHRSGIARFHLLYRGKTTPPPPRRVPGSEDEQTSTNRERPPRGGASGGGDGGGTATGGDE